ncbi:MAG TPA: alpha/beta fold hydrolase [Methylophilaceae bacterium]|nr:alpha/beta fold hydrolase [Methylophilaceae bacterium]
MQLHYQSLGEGQPLVLLHGLFGSSNNWGIIAKHFSQTHKVVCVDLRNHGRSPHHHSQTYAEMANDLLELCNTLNLETTHLLGHSLGGKVAMQFATQYPKRIDKLIVVDMAKRAYTDEHSHLIDAMMSVDLANTQIRSDVDNALKDSIPNMMVRQFLLMNLIKTNNGLEWRINLPALKANYAEFISPVCENSYYHQPSLFIYGERSNYLIDSDISSIPQHFTQAEFTSLPTGHWVHAEAPQKFIKAVSAFLN